MPINNIPAFGELSSDQLAVVDAMTVRNALQTMVAQVCSHIRTTRRAITGIGATPLTREQIQARLDLLGPSALSLLNLEQQLLPIIESIAPGAINTMDIPGMTLVPKQDGSGVDAIAD